MIFGIYDRLVQWFLTFLTRNALLRMRFYDGAYKNTLCKKLMVLRLFARVHNERMENNLNSCTLCQEQNYTVKLLLKYSMHF